MLKELRRKFILVTMIIVTLMLSVIFGLMYYSTASNLKRASIQMMRTVSLTRGAPKYSEVHISNVHGDHVLLPYIKVRLNTEMEIIDVTNASLEIPDDETIHTLVAMAYESSNSIGVIEEHELRFFKRQRNKGDILVFSDMSSEYSVLYGFLRSLAIIGILAFLIFWAICSLLARWVIKPAEQAWHQQKQFIADASHELKTPLTVIMTNAELLRNPSCTPEEQKQLSSGIITMSDQMKSLIERMLELARVDNTTVQNRSESISLSDIVATEVMVFEPILFDRNLIFSYDITPSLYLTGNSDQLKQLVNILLDNACKYSSPDGSVRLSLIKTQRKHLLLTVTNQGNSISQEDMHHIFERFYRGDKARTRNQSYGLGLSIAQSIVEQHHGKIWVESDNGYNTFYVEF